LAGGGDGEINGGKTSSSAAVFIIILNYKEILL
jgi:hypothetical protein